MSSPSPDASDMYVTFYGRGKPVPAERAFFHTGDGGGDPLDELSGLIRYHPAMSRAILADPPPRSAAPMSPRKTRGEGKGDGGGADDGDDADVVAALAELDGLVAYAPTMSLALSPYTSPKPSPVRGEEEANATETETMVTEASASGLGVDHTLTYRGTLAARTVDLTLTLALDGGGSASRPESTSSTVVNQDQVVRFEVTAPSLDVIPWSQLELETVLSRGGFAVVWRARYMYDEVAVKIVSSLAYLGQVQSFVEEVAMLAALRHANVVFLVGICTEVSRCAIVMENMAGGDLARALHGKHRIGLEIGTRLRIVRDVARGLAYLHRHGLPHRDLKPANVLLVSASPLVLNEPSLSVRAKIADFGLSGVKLSHAGRSFACTLRYAAPEVLLGEVSGTVSHSSLVAARRCDMYSFGLLAVEVLSGVRPFEHLAHAADRHANVYAPPFSDDTLDIVDVMCDDAGAHERPESDAILAALSTLRS
ncbi:TKL protein kinase [Thecamonas trahens ATCC 50062]|uniref:TKL protein kinase n=1 Tax=Thecamonas trahens ATCC 50062 TaxID=461836 RepID=A0A0L0DNB7_THETB|nr:TKL protein kinase [Thecamonas trahens ATCC 50062]KNC52908.1 TKL protein kinase [Thecamonas trahens ATCC 50062]|eukprot:XP_013755002.1 TKL protein kinase [Thecamonas trahens ATCC 50062]